MNVFLKGDPAKVQLVGATEPPSGDFHGYDGPVARVYADQDWLFIVTDDYEGSAMLNIEALPALIMALERLTAHIKATSENIRQLEAAISVEEAKK